MDLYHRGLYITCTVTPHVAATWLQPAEGGEVEDVEWEVDDIVEVLEWLELPTARLDCMVIGFYKVMGRLPKSVADLVDRDFNITEAAEEAAAEWRPDDE